MVSELFIEHSVTKEEPSAVTSSPIGFSETTETTDIIIDISNDNNFLKISIPP